VETPPAVAPCGGASAARRPARSRVRLGGTPGPGRIGATRVAAHSGTVVSVGQGGDRLRGHACRGLRPRAGRNSSDRSTSGGYPGDS
jgi:hypothetical protein